MATFVALSRLRVYCTTSHITLTPSQAAVAFLVARQSPAAEACQEAYRHQIQAAVAL